MTARVFVDTNVLIYARDLRDNAKCQTAQRWLDELASRRRLLTNLQVLNEFTRWLLLNERSAPLDRLRREIELLGEYGGQTPLDRDDVDLAWDVREKLGYQWFDCLLVAAAANAGCSHFLSEDMGHETRYGSLTIINPFRVDPDAFLKAN
jgi:predicted nucleic acid-binding protein